MSNTNPDRAAQRVRYWPTAKALRALNIAVPPDVDDDEAVLLVEGPPCR